ncbi:MAG: hypothetical protein EOM12_12860 [Verrucomicrobiae bacterium]|nr:hypothetical protein [Verrucomicrobiae bacterium]
MLNEQTFNKLYEMRLSGMAEAYKKQDKDPEMLPLTFEERFSMLVESQWLKQENSAIQKRLKTAKLRIRDACVENIDWKHRRGLERPVIMKLAESEWIRYKHNCVITGPTGVGKSFLACALGQKACRDGYKVLYYHSPKLFRELLAARAIGNTSKILRKVSRVNMLVIDDWGLETVEQPSLYRDILEIIDECQQQGSLLITSQYPVDEWHRLIGDSTVADAILDRIIHNANKVELKGESMRKAKASISES